MDQNPFENKTGQEKLNLKIEKAKPEDWQVCKNLFLEALKSEDAEMLAATPSKVAKEEGKGQEWWEYNLDSEYRFVLLLKNRSQAVGINFAEKKDKGIWYIHSSYIKPDFRGGAGKKLFAARLEEIANRGGEEVLVAGSPTNLLIPASG